MIKLKRPIVAASLLLLLVTAGLAQGPKPVPFKPFDRYDAAFWAGGGLDIATSIGKREINPLLRDRDGMFSPQRAVALKASLWAAFKLLEYRYDTPRERKLIKYSKAAAGIAFGIVALLHNRNVPPARR